MLLSAIPVCRYMFSSTLFVFFSSFFFFVISFIELSFRKRILFPIWCHFFGGRDVFPYLGSGGGSCFSSSSWNRCTLAVVNIPPETIEGMKNTLSVILSIGVGIGNSLLLLPQTKAAEERKCKQNAKSIYYEKLVSKNIVSCKFQNESMAFILSHDCAYTIHSKCK